jgi:hypothetical protein
MQMFWGSYGFAVNSTLLSASIETLKNSGGQPYAQRKSITVTAYLYGNGDTALTQAENALKTALAQPYQDLIFYTNEGGQSSEVLLNAKSITGVVITKGPDFKSTSGAEYCTERTCTFTAEAEYQLPGTSSYLLSFTESLTFWGGKPIYAHRLAINATPQKQLIWPYTTYQCTQQGTAVSYQLPYPRPKAPWFPNALKEGGRFPQKSPTRKGNGYEGYEQGWEYHFESATPLAAVVPNFWP